MRLWARSELYRHGLSIWAKFWPVSSCRLSYQRIIQWITTPEISDCMYKRPCSPNPLNNVTPLYTCADWLQGTKQRWLSKWVEVPLWEVCYTPINHWPQRLTWRITNVQAGVTSASDDCTMEQGSKALKNSFVNIFMGLLGVFFLGAFPTLKHRHLHTLRSPPIQSSELRLPLHRVF